MMISAPAARGAKYCRPCGASRRHSRHHRFVMLDCGETIALVEIDNSRHKVTIHNQIRRLKFLKSFVAVFAQWSTVCLLAIAVEADAGSDWAESVDHCVLAIYEASVSKHNSPCLGG